MTRTKERPPPGEGGPLELPLHSGAGNSLNAPKSSAAQAATCCAAADRVPPLRLVPPPPPPRLRRIEVRISARDGRAPRGRSCPFRLTEPDLAWLIEAAERLEAQR
jgi:hypothetical protein